MTVYGLRGVYHPTSLVQTICGKPPAGHMEMVGALPYGRLIPLQIDAGDTSDAGGGQSVFGEDRLDPIPHFGKRGVSVATDPHNEAGRPQDEDVCMRCCQKGIRNHDTWG